MLLKFKDLIRIALDNINTSCLLTNIYIYKAIICNNIKCNITLPTGLSGVLKQELVKATFTEFSNSEPLQLKLTSSALNGCTFRKWEVFEGFWSIWTNAHQKVTTKISVKYAVLKINKKIQTKP